MDSNHYVLSEEGYEPPPAPLLAVSQSYYLYSIIKQNILPLHRTTPTIVSDNAPTLEPPFIQISKTKLNSV